MSHLHIRSLLTDSNLDIKIINALSQLQSIGGSTVQFSDVLFVSSAGDNSDGSSWEKAYTSITTALDWIASNQSSGEFHLVMVGAGSFDINTTGDPSYDEKIGIVGLGRDITTITNGHASATSVLKMTGIGLISNLKIDTGATSIDGLVIDGTSADGFEINNVYFEGDGATGAMSLLQLSGGVEYVKVKHCKFHGVAANTTAIHLNDCIEGEFENNYINTALIGIHLDHADDDNNIFMDFRVALATTGIQIDNAGSTSNMFKGFCFKGCTTKVNDSGTSTILSDICAAEQMIASVAPDDLTGVAVTAGVGANTLGNATQIRSAASATKPFYVTGIMFEPDTAEKWGIALYDDGGTTPFMAMTIEQARGVANVAQREMFVEKYMISQGTAIHAKAKSETGSNAVDIWIYIEEI